MFEKLNDLKKDCAFLVLQALNIMNQELACCRILIHDPINPTFN